MQENKSSHNVQLVCLPIKRIDGKLPEDMVELEVNGTKVMANKNDYQVYKSARSAKSAKSAKNNLKGQPLKLTADGKVPDGMVKLLVNGKPCMVAKTEYLAHQRQKLDSSRQESTPVSDFRGKWFPGPLHVL